MGWTSYFTDNTNREECEKYVKKYEKEGIAAVKRTAMKGNNFYALLHSTKSDADWVLCLLTSRRDGQFFYKDVQCNPWNSPGGEIGDIPMSILKDFVPSTDFDKEWKEKNLKWHEKENAKFKPELFDVLHMKNTSNGSIEWNNGYKIEQGQEFYIGVKNINNRKNYVLLEKRKTARDLYSPDGKLLTDSEGKTLKDSEISEDNYIFVPTNMRLTNSSMKYMTILEKDEPVRNCHNYIDCIDLFEYRFKNSVKQHKMDGWATMKDVVKEFESLPLMYNTLLEGFSKRDFPLETKEHFDRYFNRMFGCPIKETDIKIETVQKESGRKQPDFDFGR